MRILSYNVNGIRAALSKGLADWMAQENPDVLCLQETKAQLDQIPQTLFEDMGYKGYFVAAEKKGYSGVGILTKKEPVSDGNVLDVAWYSESGTEFTIDTIEEGKMTKDLALITSLENPTVLNSEDFIKAIAEKLGDNVIYQETGGMVGSQNIDGGRASEAIKLEPGKESGRFVSINGDGYYFVKLINKTETEVNFVSIKIPFTEFQTQFDNLRSDDKIHELITINEDA